MTLSEQVLICLRLLSINMDNYKIINGIIVQPHGLLYDHTLVVENNTIVDITQKSDHYGDIKTIDAEGKYVSPGFVELHIHGCSYYGFDMPDKLDMKKVVSFLKKRGINTFVPTFQCNRDVVRDFVSIIHETPELRISVPGIYIEGPFINEVKKGGISENYISMPDTGLLEDIVEECRGWLKLMTVAPELKGSNTIIDKLKDFGIIPCFGHSSAELGDISITEGEKLNMTHLFNAMSPVTHKKSGLAMLPFLNRDVFFELNGDGIHVSNEAVLMCYKNLNKEKLILVSDAVISSGLEYGDYESYGRAVVSNEKGVRYKEDNVLMGSNLLMNNILKRFISLTGAPLYEAVRFASLNPSELLGISSRKGSLEQGKEADIILLDKEYNVVANLF